MEGGGYYPKILPKPHTGVMVPDGVMTVPDGGNTTWAGKAAITSSESKASGKSGMPKSSASEHDSKSFGKSAAAADAKSSTNKRNDDNEEEEGQELREQDRFMPIANVIRIMRKVLPTHAKISDDAKETIQECVSEYISFITSEANDRCQKEQRKTITAEDVLWAMNKLGFDDYVEPLSMYLQRYREVEGEHRGSIRGEPLPLSLKRSRQDMSLYGPSPAYHMGHFHQQQHQHHPVMYGGGMAGYYREGGGSSTSSHEPMPGFDPSYPFYNK